MVRINTNIIALGAANASTQHQRVLGQSMQRLSTGLRVNSAADDAAGLAISSRMTSQILGLNQAVRNANDAISMLQIADGGLANVAEILYRMKEIAVQAGSDSNTFADKTALQGEISELTAEVDRIATNTQFNNSTLLDKLRKDTCLTITKTHLTFDIEDPWNIGSAACLNLFIQVEECQVQFCRKQPTDSGFAGTSWTDQYQWKRNICHETSGKERGTL